MKIQVKVKPNAKTSKLEQNAEGRWTAHIKSPPVDGKANKELIHLIAAQFTCHQSAVSIKSGASGRLKLIQIEGQ